jgi:hypothetical protein
MIAHLPIPGGHLALADRFFSPSLSFTLGWSYWYLWYTPLWNQVGCLHTELNVLSSKLFLFTRSITLPSKSSQLLKRVYQNLQYYIRLDCALTMNNHSWAFGLSPFCWVLDSEGEHGNLSVMTFNFNHREEKIFLLNKASSTTGIFIFLLIVALINLGWIEFMFYQRVFCIPILIMNLFQRSSILR